MSVLCRLTIHGRLIGGLGGMGDAIVCLRCGAEAYEEHWLPWNRFRAEECTADNQHLVVAARDLPGGINAKVAKPDPEFDNWLGDSLGPTSFHINLPEDKK